jgi:hypothetical protein
LKTSPPAVYLIHDFEKLQNPVHILHLANSSSLSSEPPEEVFSLFKQMVHLFSQPQHLPPTAPLLDALLKKLAVFAVALIMVAQESPAVSHRIVIHQVAKDFGVEVKVLGPLVVKQAGEIGFPLVLR